MRTLLLSSVLILISNPVFAETIMPVGKVIGLQGELFSGETTLEEGADIFQGNTLETGDEARALILFKDNTEITLGEETRLTIDEYVFESKKPEKDKGRFSIRGAFLWTSGFISRTEKPDLKIDTNYGSIGIRGTKFWGGEQGEKYGVLVLDGMVSYTTDAGRILIKKDKGVFVSSETTPLKPKTWPQKKVDAAVASITFKDGYDFTQALEEAKNANLGSPEVEAEEPAEEPEAMPSKETTDTPDAN